MSKYDKNLIIKAFCIFDKENTKYTIFVATDVYSIDINNLDMKLVL